MGVLAKIGTAFKAAASAIGLRFPTQQSGWWWGAPRQNREYALAVADGSGSAIIMAIVFWVGRTFPEAPVRVSAVNAKGELKPDAKHPLSLLLARPNPHYSGALLWFATLADYTMTGNAYWLKERSAAGRVVRLWWAPSWTMEPAWNKDGSDFLTEYWYKPDGREVVKYPPTEVVHFRFGMDPRNIRKGVNPLASLIREVFTDEEAAAFTAALLRNMGVPGVVVTPTAGDDAFRITQETAEGIKAGFEGRFGGDNRGRTLVLGQPMDVKVLSFNPQQLQLRDLRRLPEERVTAVMGIPAVVVGMGAGIDRSTYNNFAEAKASAYESNILPTQRLFGEELNTQLVPDFAPDPAALFVDFDTSQVRILQPDQDAVHARAREDWLAGVITLDEALQELGREPLPNGAGLIRFVPNTGTPVHADALLPIAQAAVAPLPSGGSRNGALPPAKGQKSVERVIPAGADEPLDDVPHVTFDAAEQRALSRAWDATVPVAARGLLDAEATNGNGTH